MEPVRGSGYYEIEHQCDRMIGELASSLAEKRVRTPDLSDFSGQGNGRRILVVDLCAHEEVNIKMGENPVSGDRQDSRAEP